MKNKRRLRIKRTPEEIQGVINPEWVSAKLFFECLALDKKRKKGLGIV